MQRIIKKYPNRRLYDTQNSCYITLDELKDMIISGHSIKVVDTKSKQDISREVLLQLVAEQESQGMPILNETILTSLIQFYGHPLQKLASQYLELALQQLQNQRGQFSEQMQHVLKTPVDQIKEMTRQNIEWMSTLQKSFLGAIQPPGKPDSEDTED